PANGAYPPPSATPPSAPSSGGPSSGGPGGGVPGPSQGPGYPVFPPYPPPVAYQPAQPQQPAQAQQAAQPWAPVPDPNAGYPQAGGQPYPDWGRGAPPGNVYGSQSSAGEEPAPGQLWPGRREGVGEESGDLFDPGTGSLTGHILRQGHPDTRPGTGAGRRPVKVAFGIIAVAVAIILVAALVYALH
ncbi:MAG TPA: hypothetical protein VHA75_17485, partial [Rugosimonospora sp.]|nr:hypothetical protein [Rugosimonospora sp.]